MKQFVFSGGKQLPFNCAMLNETSSRKRSVRRITRSCVLCPKPVLCTIPRSEIEKTCERKSQALVRNQPPAATRVTQPMTTNTIDLEQEYRSVRQALVRAGLMIGSIDALHADWQRWVNDSKSAVGRRRAAWDVNQWWAHHLSLFRCLMDRAHLTARAMRKLKDSQGDSASPALNSINLSEGT
ncbi:MAG: hypothetical protein JO121_02370 [Deltaproteobacteria bacterium]|nr:hypothetical protein [Deltaproteobacteria bacterium]